MDSVGQIGSWISTVVNLIWNNVNNSPAFLQNLKSPNSERDVVSSSFDQNFLLNRPTVPSCLENNKERHWAYLNWQTSLNNAFHPVGVLICIWITTTSCNILNRKNAELNFTFCQEIFLRCTSRYPSPDLMLRCQVKVLYIYIWMLTINWFSINCRWRI